MNLLLTKKINIKYINKETMNKANNTMFCTIKPNPVVVLLLSTLFFIFSNFFPLSHAVNQFHHNLQSLRFQGFIAENEYSVVALGMRRSVLERNNVGFVENKSSLILAAKRTRRKDPLDDFKYYKGGWNISEKHYFYSVGFTAAPLFLIAALWFVGFGLCLLVTGLYYCCCQHRRYGYSRNTCALSLIFLIFFTVAAIIGCIVLFAGQGKFHSSTKDTLKYVVKKADTTVTTLRTVSDYLSAAKSVGVDHIVLPPHVEDDIDAVDKKINASASRLEYETEKNSDDIKQVLDAVREALIIIAAVMLLLAFLGFLLSVIGIQFLVYISVTLGWILVTGTFIVCGIFLILHNVLTDTCVAMDEWIQNPAAHTALDDILPCLDSATAQEALSETKDVTFNLVQVVNIFITTVSNINLPPRAGPAYFNQSGPLVPVLCNPFNSDKTDRQCASNEVNFTNAAQEWRKYICQVSASGICTTVGRLTPLFYDQMIATVNVSYALHQFGPFLIQLGDCTFVRETFGGIIEHHCPGLKRYSKWIFVGLIMVSVAVMFSLILWILYARERRHRKRTKEFEATVSAQDLLEEEKGME